MKRTQETNVFKILLLFILRIEIQM